MAVVTAVALTGSALVASNMGFKLNYSLTHDTDAGGPNIGQNSLALPDNRQSGMNASIALMNDIGFASTASVSRYIEASNGFELYTGRKGSPNADFPLAAGEAYFVAMLASVPYIVVGSDDPAITYSLTPDTDGGGPNSGQNFFAYNYHQTAANSISLMNDVGFVSTASVSRYIKAGNGYELYTGRKGSPNADFPLVPGEGYFVAMLAAVNYAPSHY
jgi:multisubunit Na+/H+ antiporter MnhF subunit